jgi:lysophospholipase L1-like esterase
MRSKVFYYCLIVLNLNNFSVGQSKPNQKPRSTYFIYKGRIEKIAENSALLISSAASVTFSFKGNTADYKLKNVDSFEHHNYFCLEVDGIYKGRFKIEKGDIQSFSINTTENKTHLVTIYKATEASNGAILFEGNTANLTEITAVKKHKIEFIGNSITCGMGNDAKEIPCGTGEWFDQHNAYWAYGSILSRKLDVDCLLSSVSGIGMYRNWNDEHIDEAIMPDVYENLYLNKDNSKPYDFKFQPDIVSICLGTNDLSDGDGIKPRLPFNEEKYVSNYIEFIKVVYKRSPKARIVLLNSPMLSGDRNLILVSCLKKVIDSFKKDKKHKKIQLFEYLPMQPKGCGYHPDIEDHKVMAAQLASFFKKLFDEK